MKEIISKDMVVKGYTQGLINLILSPYGDGIICSIGDNWFFFGGITAEEYDNVEKYKSDIPTSDIIADIYETLKYFDEIDEEEQLYYYYFLKENIEDKVILHGETHTEITDMLAEKVRTANEKERKRAERIYQNWLEFVAELKTEGMFGLTAQ